MRQMKCELWRLALGGPPGRVIARATAAAPEHLAPGVTGVMGIPRPACQRVYPVGPGSNLAAPINVGGALFALGRRALVLFHID
jgi:hypothetical protein